MKRDICLIGSMMAIQIKAVNRQKRNDAIGTFSDKATCDPTGVGRLCFVRFSINMRSRRDRVEHRHQMCRM